MLKADSKIRTKNSKHGSELDKSSIAFEKKKANLLTLFRTKSNHGTKGTRGMPPNQAN